ncbi:MAG: hypothetical protein ACMUIE_02605 [Thermoplasmatota archaeon]
MSGNRRDNLVLAIMLFGALLLSGIGFIGLLMTVDRSDDEMDNGKEVDTDGIGEMNRTLVMIGWRWGPVGDRDIDTEHGEVIDIKAQDCNSKGFVELKEESKMGFIREDGDTDGVIDHEKYAGLRKKVTDVLDDGTEINEESGTWTNKAP